jgi:hypothetical protein
MVSRHSDQYALAVTYYQLRTGRLPFTGSIGEVLEGHLHQAPDLSCLPDSERQVVARAMAKCPEERWPTCRDFVHRLEGTAVETLPSFGAGPRPTAIATGTTELPNEPAISLYPGNNHALASGRAASSRPRPVKKAGAPCNQNDLTGCDPRRGPSPRPRQLGLVATGLALAGLSAVLYLSVIPQPSPTQAYRVPGRHSAPRRRGHGFPARHLPAVLRGTQYGPRERNQPRGWNVEGTPCYERRPQGGSPPRFSQCAPHFALPSVIMAPGC